MSVGQVPNVVQQCGNHKRIIGPRLHRQSCRLQSMFKLGNRLAVIGLGTASGHQVQEPIGWIRTHEAAFV